MVNFRPFTLTCIVQIFASTVEELALSLNTSPAVYITTKLWLKSAMNFTWIYSLVVEKVDDYFLFRGQKK
jgi:hypothetical protein